MKFIPYRSIKDEGNQVDTFAILLMYLNDARNGGADYEEMGRRIDLVKKIRALQPQAGDPDPAGLVVDHDEYQLLKGIERYRFPWGANEHVYAIIGDVRNAKAPEPKTINQPNRAA